jgi:hypothetical protein
MTLSSIRSGGCVPSLSKGASGVGLDDAGHLRNGSIRANDLLLTEPRRGDSCRMLADV